MLNAGAVAVLPIGAGAKQHGPHLPMNTDYLQAQWLAARLVGSAHVIVWPTLAYGYYPAFIDYPGSCSLPRHIFEQTVNALINTILSAGAQRLLIINTGISTIAPLEAVTQHCVAPRRLRLANVYCGSHYRAVEQRLGQQTRGGHGDESETSIMLAIAPELVRMERAVTWTRPMVKGPFQRRDPTGPNYSPSGLYGDPCLASRDKGEQLLQGMLQDLRAALA